MAVLAGALLVSACTNNRATPTTSREINTDSPLDNIITDLGKSALVLSRIVKNSTAPTSVFDLVGDGSGSMGTQCTSTAAAEGSSQGSSTCTCSYTYTKTDGSIESFETPTIYHESNLIRCVYSGIPAATSSVKVKIHITSSDTFSNEITYKFAGTGTSLDTAKASTFVPVSRYQCRDSVTIPLPGLRLSDAGMVYDRFQSEDKTNTYPLNFYTPNLGGALAIFAGGFAGVQPPLNWNCPAIPNDPNAGLDLRVYSVASEDTGPLKPSGVGRYVAGKKQIYPPVAGAFDRMSFLVAKNPTGVFNVPINGYIAPTIFTATASEDSLNVPPLGYGASPIPTGVSGQETCPDSSIAIPRGYHWVKVWLFRMALNPRKYLLSQKLVNLGEIQCSPGKYPNLAGLVGISQYAFPDCAGSVSIQDLDGLPNPSIVSRMFQNNARCVKMDPVQYAAQGPGPGVGPGQTWNSATSSVKAAYASYNYPAGADVMLPNNAFASEAPYVPYACKAGTDPTDYAHTCAKGVAYDETPTTGYIDAEQNGSGVVPYSRFDYLFVTTPPTVMSKDMADSSSSVAALYTPYRFLTPEDCRDPGTGEPYADPDAAGCDARRALRNYGVKFHEVGTSGDPPADDPNRPGSFPVCALQADN